MKSIFIFTALFLLALPLYAQVSEKALNKRRDWYKEVSASIGQYRKVEFPDIIVSEDLNPGHYSMEGMELYRLGTVNMTKFFDGDQIVKIEVNFYADREDLISEYYFKNGDLFFVDKVKTVYHKAKWDDEFKETDKSIAKNRFYFKDNQLVRWIKIITKDPELKIVGKMDPSYKDHESKILNDYSLYLGIN